MNFIDRWETDENGKQYLFTVAIQRKLSQLGLPVEPASLEEAGIPIFYPGDTAPSRSRSYDDAPAKSKAAAPAAPAEKSVPMPEAIHIDPETGKYLGRLKWFSDNKGYGFILRGAGKEIFVHKSSFLDESQTQLAEGTWVLYDVEERNKGPEATEVEPYSGDTSAL